MRIFFSKTRPTPSGVAIPGRCAQCQMCERICADSILGCNLSCCRSPGCQCSRADTCWAIFIGGDLFRACHAVSGLCAGPPRGVSIESSVLGSKSYRVKLARNTGGQFISGPHTETRAARQRGLCFAQIVAARGARGAGPWVRPVFRPQARSPMLSLVATRLFRCCAERRWAPMPMLLPWFEIGAVFGTARCRFLPLSAKCVFGHLWATCRRVLPRLPGARRTPFCALFGPPAGKPHRVLRKNVS